MFFPSKKRLGELLTSAQVISNDQLENALRQQKETGERLGSVLVNLDYATELDIARVLETQLNIRHVEISKEYIETETARLITESLAQRYKVIPVKKKGNHLILAMADPLDVFAIDDVRMTTGLEVEPVIATETEISMAINKHFGLKDSLNEIISSSVDENSIDDEIDLATLTELVEDAPIVKLVNNIITQAVLENASDIHIEPQEEGVRVRYRLDGVLFDRMNSPKKMQAPIISRLKIMADMDIAERRIPQDGRIQMVVDNREIDLRVSTLPILHGEKVVMRILDKSKGLYKIDDLGLIPQSINTFKSIIKNPYGIILVTGPTGSGKTTTLYSILSELNKPEENIITLEDPVEYTLQGVNQVQLNVKAGLTFASGLRSILRQDPDVIMVGEIRDSETAKIAIQSAMTGHLVLSTLHTNTAAATLTRLTDMDVEPFLVASSVVGIISQRLVRALCQCKEPYQINPEFKKQLGLNEIMKDIDTLYKPKGCPFCNDTGYKGRIALHEVMSTNSEIRELTTVKASADKIEQGAVRNGMITIKEDGIYKAIQGLTSLEEVMRMVHMDEEG